jgi:hypothetical protein
VKPADELAELARFYGLEASLPAALAPGLDTYAEWVLDPAGCAVVTLGPAEILAGFAPAPARARFLAAHARWPSAITGIKLDLAARAAPTVYVRATCPWAEGAAFLADIGLDPGALPAARTLYGLGFQADVVKTYALAPGGFVSWRLDAGGLLPAHKAYRADVPWDAIAWPDARAAEIGRVGQALGFTAAGHVAHGAGGWKVYVERRGGIPTDRSLS